MAKIDPLVQSISVTEPPGGLPGEQIITMQLRYVGEENIAEEILQDEEVSIEIPSHAPPPEG